MAAGMVIISAAAAMLIRSKQAAEPPNILLWPLAAAGVIIYIIGRIGIFLKNRRKQKERRAVESDSDES